MLPDDDHGVRQRTRRPRCRRPPTRSSFPHRRHRHGLARFRSGHPGPHRPAPAHGRAAVRVFRRQ
ncbi:hypothetical protein HBB16_18030 [Pseudonocardia sp. MCCB 268]|nr:hypothetical protein [Pseudonocardia cytotoxica]